MADSTLKQRKPVPAATGAVDGRTASSPPTTTPASAANSRSEKEEAGLLLQIVRGLLLTTWTACVCVTAHTTQLIGAPLYFINKGYYYAWMALTKQSFALLIISVMQWFAPITVRISGEKACRAQLKLRKDGTLESAFPERLVMIANHQLYSDWLFLWWIAYTSRMHGHIYIILKESLKYVPILGPGMMFYGFVFMARKWATDQPRLKHRLQKLNSRHGGPLSGSQSLDPMWLMIFPEGTNLSANTRRKSAAFAAKQGIQDFRQVLLPRSTGLQFCLQELKDTVEWVYDCTVAYEGIPPGEYGQDVYTNMGIYLGGRPPKSVNMHWRRFHTSSIPYASPKDFEAWVMDRWREKEALLEHFAQTGRFPADTDTPASSLASSMIKEDGAGGVTSPWAKSMADGKLGVPGEQGDIGAKWADGSDAEYLETKVGIVHWVELLAIFVPLATVALIANIGAKGWKIVRYGSMSGSA